MKNQNYLLKMSCGVMICTFVLSGCTGNREPDTNQGFLEVESREETDTEENNDLFEIPTETADESAALEPEIVETDWSEYFNGLNGAAVVYDTSAGQYAIYNPELAMTQRSPCSTFKIISSWVALKIGVIEPERSTRIWSGEVFWNEKWNNDMNFCEAFESSCVWYFREVIDDIGKDRMQAELEKLQYGNCDVSDWEGQANTNNSNRALTGFWLESSLKISPKEQVEVMERIFGVDTDDSEELRKQLKEVMLVSNSGETGNSIYGKTGTGQVHGVVVDAWFTGFAEKAKEEVYFCVYLGETDGAEVSGLAAKEIAVRLVEDYCGN